MTTFTIERGFPAEQVETVARIYWQAFSEKLGMLFGPDDRGIAFFAQILNPDYILTAISGDEVLGIAGFKTSEGAMTGGGLRDITRKYGWFGGLWRGILAGLAESKPENGSLLLEAICVSDSARNGGVGSALLQAIKDEAASRGLGSVMLEVVDSNPRARALYERQGFVAGETERMGPLKYVFGFSSSVTMRYAVPAKDICRDAAN